MIGLDPFHEEVLESFFSRTSGFFLTGGAALAAHDIHGRSTESLEFCTLEDDVRLGEAALLETATDVGAKAQRLESSDGSGRFLLRRGDESLVVDISRDLSPQVEPEKIIFGEVWVDGPLDIAAKKLCSLRANARIRDLVDLRALEIAGYTVEDHLASAARKDSELTPANLVSALADVEIGDDLKAYGDVSPEDLRSYLAVLILRLNSMAPAKV